MALAVLEGVNRINRKLRQWKVDTIARDLCAGRWRYNGAAIRFDTQGRLLDGQHRLWACVEANRPITTAVAFNLARQAGINIDTAMPRNGADGLNMTGKYGVVNNFSMATLRAMVTGFGKPPKLSRDEEGELFTGHQAAVSFADEVMGSSARVSGITTGSTRAVLARAFYTCDQAKLREFARVLITSQATNNGDAVVVRLRDWLIANMRSGGTMGRRERYGKTERALKAYLAGENIRHIYACTTEQFPLPEEVNA
ncbi:MAG TPA: hypothetical protein VNA25_02465 [Phycisphaerae bacterium]|nr:hypothetical protein [Phycisphaerae bacterium]